MNREKIEFLLKYLYRYFPIGVRYPLNDYAGLQEYKSIMDRKINELMSIPTEGLPILDLINSVKNYADYRIEDLTFLQMPSYSFFLENQKTEWKGTIVKDNLHIDISLLAPIYTIYIARTYSYENRKILPCGITFLKSIDIGIFPLISKIKLDVEEKFPQYKSYSMHALNNFLIEGGIPFKLDQYPIKTLPIYYYLFNPSIRDNYMDYD